MKTIKMNVSKMHRSNYGKYSYRTNSATKILHGIEVPADSSNKTEPYMYRAALYFNDRSGVQTKQFGVALRELREEYGVSRRAFAELATSLSAQYGIELKVCNIVSYEKKHTWKNKYTGRVRVFNACSPKIDKLMSCILACMSLSGCTYEQAFMRLTGYTKVESRNLKVG